MNQCIIEMKNVTVSYGSTPVLKNICLSVFEKDFIGIIGPNGRGKTTLLKVIIGLLPIEDGEIVKHMPQSVGYLPQLNKYDNQFPISVKEVVLSGLFGQHGLFTRYKKKDFEKVDYWLEYAKITHLSKRNFGTLSGGQRQRVLLCRALVGNPQLLVLDEPNMFVDSQFELELYELLKLLNEQITILMVSHNLKIIYDYTKSIVYVNNNLCLLDSNKINNGELLVY